MLGVPKYTVNMLSNGTVTIMDLKGDQFMVNGQRLKVYYEPDVVPLHHVDVFTMEEEPNVWPRTRNKAWNFINSFSFNFLEFLTKIYWAKFFPWAEKAKKGGTRETGPDRPPEQGGPAGPVRSA
jgi:hypothetical protein